MDICLEFAIEIMITLSILWLLFCREVDSNGIDTYDKYHGFGGNPYTENSGYTRGVLGTIYKDGKYDTWANFLDHNPYYN